MLPRSLPRWPHGLGLGRCRSFLFLTLALFMLSFHALAAQAGSPESLEKDEPSQPGAVSVRAGADYAFLVSIDQSPDVTVADDSKHKSGKHNSKAQERYDVSKIGARHVDHGVNFYSLDREMAMGKEMAKEWESQARLLEDQAVNHYVNELAQRLVRHSDAKVPFTVKVVNDDEINAFALPGGYFYVNTGLILAAQNEAELAGVMAHEIAHVAARHATRGMTKSQIWNLASIPMVFIGGPVGLAVHEVSSVAFPMSTLKFGRDAEREADLLGLEYAYAAGYDPVAFVNFFERLRVNHKKPSFMAKAFATHPMNEDRIKRAQTEIDTMLPPHDEYVLDTSDFDNVQSRLFELMNARPVMSTNGGPVLRRRTGDQPQQDDGRPELKRR
jgi:beta-barrel assembly-enhancing protease